jgi:DNA invertase Pin-like site-specific DNA recombinase
MSKKVYAYARVSSIGQAAEGRDGYRRQRAAIEAWAKHANAEIVDTFEDAISGVKEWKDRPGLLTMLEAIFANGVRTIVVENLTRLARSVVVQENCIMYLASKGVHIISADTGEDVSEAMSADPMRKALIQMVAIFSELEKSSLVRKLRAARQRKRAATGRCEGVLPFGAKPGEAETLATILRYHQHAGRGAQWIATRLNRDGIPTRNGGRWRSSTVGGILMRAKSKRGAACTS